VRRGMGRLVQFDEASRGYPIRALLPPRAAKKPRSYTWRVGVHRNQGSRPWCVDYGWCHEFNARPVVIAEEALPAPGVIYNRCKDIDGFGRDVEGTSVLAGAKVARELGHLDEFRWAFSLDDLIDAVAFHGPAVMGTNWLEGMMEPQGAGGYIHATGDVVGGHCYLVNGVSLGAKAFRIWQSWDWSTALISFSDMDKLLHDQGEACIPVRRR
jgi:hypothetical protein